MNEPKVSMLVALSALSSGVPVKPMNIASGRSCFMAVCILPDCVRWASSTKTKMLPLALKSLRDLGVELRDEVLAGLVERLVVIEPRNLCTSEQMSHSCDLFRVSRGRRRSSCGRSAR